MIFWIVKYKLTHFYLLFDEFPHLYRSFVHYLHNIDPTWQMADVDLRFRFTNGLLKEFPAVEVKDG